jgi:hypothetical protein
VKFCLHLAPARGGRLSPDLELPAAGFIIISREGTAEKTRSSGDDRYDWGIGRRKSNFR